ncbi:hypothetical protein R69619_03327 [Paraburkholderia nemoris]|uniref:hypothetical protein n=1 Tax=Paraburkholderia nemoris TaxID=2793076 RepID=UPI00190CDA29|nr:hypothetical protein [Paraburkholderia nemoris]MBK3743345.1 hypothetical protein [Paraburkholderia aspalathi]CAE6759962.1 hypothetical protein R69619_03327 [Paraburkholderia nemoris]
MLKSIYLNGYKESYTAEEVAANLEAILNRQQLLTVVAARVAGFSLVAAGALLNGVDGHPDELARVVELFEQDQPEVFASLVDEVVAAIGVRGVRAAWWRHKQANAVGPRDVLMEIHTKLVDLGKNPTPAHRMARVEARFEALQTSKRRTGPAPAFEGWSVTSH